MGTEFTLSAEMIAAFKKREEEHNVSLKGWSMDPSPSNPQQAEKERNYLHSIRNVFHFISNIMSFMSLHADVDHKDSASSKAEWLLSRDE